MGSGPHKAVKTVAIVAKTSSPAAVDLARQAAAALKAKGVRVAGDARTGQAAGSAIEILPDEQVGESPDLVLVLGGDGTFIRAVSMIRGSGVPVLGINVGWLGFLTDFTRNELESALSGIASGSFESEERMRLRVTIMRGRAVVCTHDVLNEVVVVKNAMSPMIHMDVTADGVFVSRFRGDGVMAATPTGSTGYNLAVHGPIVHSTLKCILLTPISPHIISYRPLILPAGTKTVIRLSKSRGKTFANLDGLRGYGLDPGDEVLVEESPEPVRVVVPGSRDYFNVLRSKLGWGEE